MRDGRGPAKGPGTSTANSVDLLLEASAVNAPNAAALRDPDGFLAALTKPAVSLDPLDVGGRMIARRLWGNSGTGIVLVHGGSAHSQWWDHIGPSIASRHRVVALDLSGHGNSTYPGTYSFPRWAEEVAAVCDDLARITGRPPLVVGHSMGGIAALTAAMSIGPSLTGIVVLDPIMRKVSEAEMSMRRERARRPAPRYDDPEAAYARFRVIPESAAIPAHMLDHLAKTSLRRYPDGWGWSFDMRIFGQPVVTAEHLHPLGCPGLVVRAENGRLSPHTAATIVHRAQLTGMTTLEGSGHHIPLERPDEVVDITLRAAAEWAR